MKNYCKRSENEISSNYSKRFAKLPILIFLFAILLSTTEVKCLKIVNVGKNAPALSVKELLENHPHRANTNFELLRSYRDKKDYELISLKSGLEVMIISDPKLAVASAAMTVHSGVRNERDDVHGLAHYCEHMLFLGSKKYPKPTDFIEYLSKHGGKFNGFTDFDTTGFFFKIGSDFFDHAFDIFANFFIDPLFDETYYIKEVNSVNSEFERNIQTDRKRKEQVLRDNAYQGSLFHKFSTGNTNTLLGYTSAKKMNLRELVVEYFKNNYRMDRMKLVIMGNDDVDVYKKLVDRVLGQVEKPLAIYKPAPERKEAFDKENLGKLILFKTINTHQLLDISIKIPDIHKALPDNISLIFRIILNKKGTGSLDDILKKKGYLTDFQVGIRRVYDGFSMFKIGGNLTVKGIQKIEDVISIIFGFINEVKEKVIDQKIYDFYRKVLSLRFQYNKKKQSVMKFMKDICISIWKYPRKYIIAKHALLSNYDKEKIKKFSDYLTLENALVLVGNRTFQEKHVAKYSHFLQDFNSKEITYKQDNWYHTQYASFKFNKTIIEVAKIIPNLSVNILKTSTKPLPKHISLVKRCHPEKVKSCVKEMKRDRRKLKPVLLKNDKFIQSYYKQDRSFYISKVNAIIKVILDDQVNDSKFATLLRFYVAAINHKLSNYLHEESLRQNFFKINASPNGFTVRVFSYQDLIKEVANGFFSRLKSLKIEKDEFTLVRDKLRNQIDAKLNLPPSMTAYINFFSLVLKDYVRNRNIIEELDKITIEEFNHFVSSLFNSFFLKTFVHGAITDVETNDLIDNIQGYFPPPKPITNKDIVNYRNHHADLSGYFIFREKLKNVYNINHAIINFYQIGEENVNHMIFANMVKELCTYIYFSELRIKQQLGYIAKGKVFAEGNVIYYMILVQGSTKTPDFMDLKIDDLLDKMRERIANASEEKFHAVARKVVKKLKKRDANLKKRTNRLWSEIITQRGYYNMKKIFARKEEAFTKKDLLGFFDSIFRPNLKKLSIQEFSYKVNKIPSHYPTSRDHQAEKVDSQNFFRKRGKFLGNQNTDPSEKERVARNDKSPFNDTEGESNETIEVSDETHPRSNYHHNKNGDDDSVSIKDDDNNNDDPDDDSDLDSDDDSDSDD